MSDAMTAALKTALEAMGLQDSKSILETIESRQTRHFNDSIAEHVRPAAESIEKVHCPSEMGNFDSSCGDCMIDALMTHDNESPTQPVSVPPSFQNAHSILSLQSLCNTGLSEISCDANASNSSDMINNNLGSSGGANGFESPVQTKGADEGLGGKCQPPSEDDGNGILEDIIDRLSDNTGNLQIGSDGKVRYYGPTSHFNLLRMPTPDNLTVHRDVRRDGKDHLHRLDLDKDVPQDLEDHLLDLYFSWNSPPVDIVDRETFEIGRYRWQYGMETTPGYSEALQNAM